MNAPKSGVAAGKYTRSAEQYRNLDPSGVRGRGKAEGRMGSIGSRDFSPEEVCFWDATSGEPIALPNYQPSQTLVQLARPVESVSCAIHSNGTEKKRWPGDRSRSLPSVNAFRTGGYHRSGRLGKTMDCWTGAGCSPTEKPYQYFGK